MEVGLIPTGGPGVFSSLLLPQAAQALEEGEPLLALGLTEGSLAVGALAGAVEAGQFQVLSFYVAPDWRRKGGGRQLMEALLRVLPGLAHGVRVDYTATRPEHDTLAHFLTALGFAREQGWSEDGETTDIFALPVGEVLKAPFFRGGHKAVGVPFRELSDGALSLLEKAAYHADAPVPQGGLRGESVDRDVSYAYHKGADTLGYVVFCRRGNALVLEGAWSGTAGPAVLAGMLRSAAAAAGGKYPPETQFLVQPVNSASAALFRTLLPGARAISNSWVRDL